jgi:hypothetical protein
MPDPRTLRVGQRVRFVAFPDEWRARGWSVPTGSKALMRTLITRGRPCRVAHIDEDGYPWIDARTRRAGGRLVYHRWRIAEATGWVRVRRRTLRPRR